MLSLVTLAAASSCNATLVDGINAGGAAHLTIVKTANATACCAACAAEPHCAAFVLKTARQECYLKEKTLPIALKSGNLAGFVRVPAPSSPTAAPTPSTLPPPAFELVQTLDHPVISLPQTAAQQPTNRGGFEGGLYTKTPEDEVYHLFPTECMSDMPGVAWDVSQRDPVS